MISYHSYDTWSQYPISLVWNHKKEKIIIQVKFYMINMTQDLKNLNVPAADNLKFFSLSMFTFCLEDVKEIQALLK